MQLPADDVAVFLDTWGIRRMFSLAVRRRGCPRKSRDPVLDHFFQVLEKHWGQQVSKGQSTAEAKKAQKVHDMEEDQEVDPKYLSDTEVSDALQFHLFRAETDEYMLVCTPQKEKPIEQVSPEKVEIKGEAISGMDVQADDLDGMGDIDLDLEEQLLLQKLALLRPHIGEPEIYISPQLLACFM